MGIGVPHTAMTKLSYLNALSTCDDAFMTYNSLYNYAFDTGCSVSNGVERRLVCS